jgi:hypothetical protein
VIPDKEVLVEEYRRQHQSAFLRRHFGDLLERSRKHIADLHVSADLEKEVVRLLQEELALAWDDAVAEIAERTAANG